MGKIIEIIGFAMLGAVVLFFLYVLFVIMPVTMYAEAKCLRSGFPSAHVTVGLERYCSTLDGSVTVKVEKLSK